MRTLKENIIQLIVFITVLLWSAVNPHDYFTWILEVAPAIIGAVVLVMTYKKFRLTPLTYWLILIHAVILIIGGHYTYSEVPIFNWMKDILDLERNNYDKLGHFAQGFVPAIITREILLRKTKLIQGRWLFFIVVSVCLAISSFYEMIEWFVAVVSGAGAVEFLGTQGYIWDTQSDMFYCLIGALVSLWSLEKLHDRLLSKIYVIKGKV